MAVVPYCLVVHGGWRWLVTRGSPSWAALKDDYARYLLTQGSSAQTVTTYRYNAAYFARWCQGQHLDVVRVSARTVRRFVAEQLTEHSRSLAMNRLLAVRSLCRYLEREGYRKGDPTEGIPVKRTRLELPKPFSESELRRLLAAARSRRDYALVWLLIATGMRRAEVTAMRTEDVDWIQGRIRVHGKGYKERWVGAEPAAINALREYVGRRTGAIWLGAPGRQMTGSRLYKVLQRIALRAGVRDCHPHRFRVTFANQFLSLGGDLQALQLLMGHASVAITARYAGWSAADRALAQQRRMHLADRIAGPRPV